jgi:hypothetical protein
LSIIDDLFVFTINPQTKKKEIRVNPMLTEKTLPTVEKDARDLIKNLYIQCESDFMKGLEIFEAIVEKQIHDTTIQQKESLQRRSENMLAKSDFSERKQPALLFPALPKDKPLSPSITSPPPPPKTLVPATLSTHSPPVSSSVEQGKELEEKGEELEEEGKEEIDALKTDVSEKSKEIKTSLQAIMEKAKMEAKKAKMEAEKAKMKAEQGLIEIEDRYLPILRADESKMTLNPTPNPNAGPSL